MKHKKKKQKKLSLREAFPSLAREWHPEKNDTLTPDDVAPGDFIHAWWKCHLKHEWIAVIKDRINGAGCPVCPSVSRPSARLVSLASAQPEAVKFWHPRKNGNRTPDQFAHKSSIKVWWKCKDGHEWYNTIGSMRYNPHCPICHPAKGTSESYNLAVVRPDLVSQWHPTKNGSLLPTQVSPYSSKKIWWKCSSGHEWASTVSARRRQSGCPYCNREKSRDADTLDVVVPQAVPFWHPTKNMGRTPADFKSSSVEKVWWICEKGHEWQGSIVSMKKKQKCPVCREENLHLQYHNPDLAREWHPVKNGELTPDKVKPHAPIKVWWLCPRGHEYMATVLNRNRPGRKGRGCPYCSGRKDLDKESLDILFPGVAEEWHPEKNGDVTPAKTSTVNKKLRWWRCKNGHEWRASVYDRLNGKKGATCPACDGVRK